MKPKELIFQKIGGYQLPGKILGKGSFARVELAVHCLTNTKVAMKIINLNEIEDQYIRKNTLRETSILKTLRHPNVVRLYETLAHNDIYCFVTEYLEGGDLYSYMKRQKQYKFSENQSRCYFVQLLYAIQYLHSKGIIHRDLKLQNILLTKSLKTIKIVDFGLSNYFSPEDLLKTRCGSALYAAPELFDKDVQYGPSVEIWSLGVILFAMSTGKMPFGQHPNDTRDNYVSRLRRGISIEHEWILKSTSPDLKNLIIKILEPDVQRRLRLETIMSNVWVTDRSKKPLLPLPPEVVPHDVRRKIIERVAELYCKPVSKTMKSLEVDTHDAMHATYQILFHNSLWFRESTTKLITKPTSQRKNIMRISKYNLSNRRNTTRAPNNSPKKTYDIGCVATGGGSGGNSRSNLKDFDKDDSFMNAEELALLDYDYDSIESDFDMLSDVDIDAYDNIVNRNHPVHSCLKISKKKCTTYKKNKAKTVSTKTVHPPPVKEDLSHRESPLDNNEKRTCGEGFNSSKTTKGSKLYQTTLEGEFDLDKSDSCSDNENEDNRKFLVQSDQIQVTISGSKLSKGTFKITHEFSGKRAVRKHETAKRQQRQQQRQQQQSCAERKEKPCIRCLSPYEARQMLHRHTFPVTSTYMKPKTGHKIIISHQSKTQQQQTQQQQQQQQKQHRYDTYPTSLLFDFFENKDHDKGGSSSSAKQMTKQHSNKTSHRFTDNTTKLGPSHIISTPDTFLRMQQSSAPSSTTRTLMQKAYEILSYENRMNCYGSNHNGYKKDTNNKHGRRRSENKSTDKKSKSRKVSFSIQ